MLWAYFDGSADERRELFITLGGIVSSEAIWPEFEKEWTAVLTACTISMRDYLRVKEENVFLRRPEAICVNSCCGSGLPPDPANPGAEYQTVIFYFDDNEPFLRQTKPVWEKGRKYRVGWPSQIDQMLSVFNRRVPALQAVDIIAWIANQSHMGDDRARALFPIIPLHGGMADFYDYERIKKEYGNDTERTDPFAYKALPPRRL